MIIGKEYDCSLSVMLKNSKKREELIEFLKEFPEELYVKIRKAVKVFDEKKEYRNFSASEREMMRGEYKTQNGEFYSYVFCENNNQLVLYKNKLTDNEIFPVYELAIERLNFEKYSFKSKYSESIGNIEKTIIDNNVNDNLKIEKCEEIEYRIVKNLFGLFVLSYINDSKDKIKVQVNKINLDKILLKQDNFNIQTLSQNYSSKKKTLKKI